MPPISDHYDVAGEEEQSFESGSMYVQLSLLIALTIIRRRRIRNNAVFKITTPRLARLAEQEQVKMCKFELLHARETHQLSHGIELCM